MHETGCSGPVHWDNPEGWCGEGGRKEVQNEGYICINPLRLTREVQRDTCTPMFIAALFIIARTWKQPRFLLVDEWIVVHTHDGILFSY